MVQPASTAFLKLASASGTYRCITIGQFPSAIGGEPNSGKWSLNMSIESPILTVACINLPPGPGARLISVAPNALVRKSMYLAAPFTDRCGVNERKPGGIGVVALAIIGSS